MKFRLEKVRADDALNYDVQFDGVRVHQAIQALTDNLDNETYHELCHQLNGTKAEFDVADDGEAHVSSNQKFYTVQSALYRGVFWRTLNRLDSLNDYQN